MKMAGSWELQELSDARKFVAYADAYLQASRDQCLRIRDGETECTWPNAVVAIMLAAHSAELFLKGAIISRDPSTKLPRHDIDELAKLYNSLCDDRELSFDNPFQSEYLGIQGSEIEKLRKDETPQSILYRYPLDRYGIDWPGTYGFEPQSFLDMIKHLRDSYDRIGGSI